MDVSQRSKLSHLPIFDRCSTYVETRQLVFTSKMFEKHPKKSYILSEDAGRFIRKGNIGQKWVNNVICFKTQFQYKNLL